MKGQWTATTVLSSHIAFLQIVWPFLKCVPSGFHPKSILSKPDRLDSVFQRFLLSQEVVDGGILSPLCQWESSLYCGWAGSQFCSSFRVMLTFPELLFSWDNFLLWNGLTTNLQMIFSVCQSEIPFWDFWPSMEHKSSNRNCTCNWQRIVWPKPGWPLFWNSSKVNEFHDPEFLWTHLVFQDHFGSSADDTNSTCVAHATHEEVHLCPHLSLQTMSCVQFACAAHLNCETQWSWSKHSLCFTCIVIPQAFQCAFVLLCSEQSEKPDIWSHCNDAEKCDEHCKLQTEEELQNDESENCEFHVTCSSGGMDCPPGHCVLHWLCTACNGS